MNRQVIALNQMIGFSLPPLLAGQVLETCTHTEGCVVSGLMIFGSVFILCFASYVSSPLSFCPLGLVTVLLLCCFFLLSCYFGLFS